MSHSKLSFNDFLNESGLDKYYNGESSLDLRLYHDLKIFGDVAESYIELLQERYGVDVSKFEFGDYFPHEFMGDSTTQRVLIWLLPFLRSKRESNIQYKDFTFSKIKDSMECGYLV